MGKKLYHMTDMGGIVFKTERKIGDVRIPNYVYDLWLPVLGAVAIGIYGVYCRLEREGVVKAMTQRRLAKMCRIGTARLRKINEMLQDCGFIRIKQPEGAAKLMHWTCEVTVLDPPQEIGQEAIEKYGPDDYEVLSPWLVSEPSDNLSENPNGDADDAKENHDEEPNGDAIVAPLGLNLLEVAGETPPVDVLDHIFSFHQRQQEKTRSQIPKGWTGASEGEFDICQYVANLWRDGILPRQSKEIERQIDGAAELLLMHDKNVRATKETIAAYHGTEDGRDLWVSGPQSLTNVLPNFMARTRRKSPDVIRIGR